MSNFWNERYSTDEFVYGKEPNQFFKSVIDSLTPGKILIPAAGEGRDAVYAAKRGWKVFAFDQSIAGQQKALKWAKEENVTISYEIKNVSEFEITPGAYDAVALSYFHLPPEEREQFHSKLTLSLTHNGVIILEAFNPKQIRNSSGGPSDISLLMTSDSLQKEFSGLHIIECREHQILLDEGSGHSGLADVVRFVGKKITPSS